MATDDKLEVSDKNLNQQIYEIMVKRANLPKIAI
jgi:hypothetical protein